MLIEPTASGLYCEAGGFHIDPWRPVDRAVISVVEADLPPSPRLRRTAEARSAEAGQVCLRISGEVSGATWDDLAARRHESRERHVEGLMLKRWSSPYRPGRKRGDWWKWKIDPFTMDAVLIYAQPGSGRRASLFTDYTFGVWDGDELVPVAKAYSGLSDQEIDDVDRWVRRHTTERFGPVSWRRDKTLRDAETLDSLRRMLPR